MSRNIRIYWRADCVCRIVFLQSKDTGIWEEVQRFKQDIVGYYDYDDIVTYEGVLWNTTGPKRKYEHTPSLKEIGRQSRLLAEDIFNSGKGNVKITTDDTNKCIWYNGQWTESTIQTRVVYRNGGDGGF